MVRCLASVALISALGTTLGCSGSQKPKPSTDDADDPDGPHRVAVEAQLAPYLSHEVFSGVVIGLYDGGKREIYGFGAGPGGKQPTGQTLFEIGSVTKVYTNILLADAVQRREVTLDTPVADLLPTGVTVPTQDRVPITLKHLALHSSGLPRLPPSIDANEAADPYAAFGEDAL
ncbi:MAG: serine hydrolase domain-containing protein [Kofleriaceae bacterium]